MLNCCEFPTSFFAVFFLSTAAACLALMFDIYAVCYYVHFSLRRSAASYLFEENVKSRRGDGAAAHSSDQKRTIDVDGNRSFSTFIFAICSATTGCCLGEHVYAVERCWKVFLPTVKTARFHVENIRFLHSSFAFHSSDSSDLKITMMHYLAQCS